MCDGTIDEIVNSQMLIDCHSVPVVSLGQPTDH